MQPGKVLRAAIVSAVGLLSVVPVAWSAGEGPSWRIDGGDVRILVPLKPGGAFEAKTSSISGTLTPGASKPLVLAGEIAVDLASIETGISLRNRHLREKLEVSRGRGFDTAVLSQITLSDAGGADFRGETEFTGTLLLHGVSRAITGKGVIRTTGPAVRVGAEFLLTLTDFGIEPPAYMGVGVTNKVAVRVSFDASPSRGSGQ